MSEISFVLNPNSKGLFVAWHESDWEQLPSTTQALIVLYRTVFKYVIIK